MKLKAEEDALIASFNNSYAPDFDDIPAHLKTQRVAAAWFTFIAYYDSEGVCDHWQHIPLELVTDDLRQTAIGIDARVIGHIDPSDTEKYLDLFIRAFKTTFRVTRLLHPDFKTPKTIDVMLGSPREFERSYIVNPWISEVMTADQLEAASRVSDRIMAQLPDSKISDEALSIHLGRGFSTYDLLFLKGKLRLAADFLKRGHWPSPSGEFESIQQRPRNVAEAFDLLREAPKDGIRALYMACLLNHPIEDVVSQVNTREDVAMIMEIYTEEELRPMMKLNRHLKAALLEGALGL